MQIIYRWRGSQETRIMKGQRAYWNIYYYILSFFFCDVYWFWILNVCNQILQKKKSGVKNRLIYNWMLEGWMLVLCQIFIPRCRNRLLVLFPQVNTIRSYDIGIFSHEGACRCNTKVFTSDTRFATHKFTIRNTNICILKFKSQSC
jgi:hypothetical protein